MLTIQEVIQSFEKFEPKPYLCAGGHQTVGYGHRIWSHENFKKAISQKMAEELLEEDLWRFSIILHREIKQPLLVHEHAALLSFIFNVGPAAFYRSSLKQKINRGDFKGAGQEFPKWVWCRGRKLRGLLRRRLFEKKIFEGNILIKNAFWQND